MFYWHSMARAFTKICAVHGLWLEGHRGTAPSFSCFAPSCSWLLYCSKTLTAELLFVQQLKHTRAIMCDVFFFSLLLTYLLIACVLAFKISYIFFTLNIERHCSRKSCDSPVTESWWVMWESAPPRSISSACCPSYYLLVSLCDSVLTSTFPLLPILDNMGMSAFSIHLTHVTVSSASQILSLSHLLISFLFTTCNFLFMGDDVCADLTAMVKQ